MDHFTIFQDFYRVIAEMTEEEIVSTISNGTYRKTVEDVRRIFAEQGEKAANEKKIELPEITFSANYRGGRSNATLVKYLGYIVIDIDHQEQETLARILALAKKCVHTRISFISPKGMGLKIVVRVCRPALRLMCRDCFMMFIPVSMFARRRPCLLSNCISFCMRTPSRSVCVVHRLLLP